MFSQPGLLVLCLTLGLLQVISASPLVAPQSASTCSARNLAIVKRTVSDEVYFCEWWQADTRTRSPFLEFTVNEVNTLCKCISPVTKTTSSKHKRSEPSEGSSVFSRSEPTAICSLKVSRQFTEPWHFCTFFNAYPRTTSPFRAYNAKELKTLCDCVLGKAVSSTSKKTSTSSHRASTTSKKSTQTSTRLSSSTKKPLSSTTKSSSSTKKSSSSIKTSSSTSHKSSSSTYKAATTSSKLIHSNSRLSSSSKSTLSTQKASTSSKASSSPSKTTSISSRATTTSTPKSSSSRVTTSSLVSAKVSSSILLPSLIIKTSSSTSTTLSPITTSSSRLISNSTTQISSSTDSSSTIDGLPTIAVSSTSVPEFTATTTSCDSLMGLLCVSLAIGPSTTSTIGTAAPDGSDPTESPVQPTTTAPSATEISLPTTTTSASSTCTPILTSCADDATFVLLASSSYPSFNGAYALVSGRSVYMSADYKSASRFCLNSYNNLVSAGNSGYAVKSSSNNPVSFASEGDPLVCTSAVDQGCTDYLQCTWEDDFIMLVDSMHDNRLFMADEQLSDIDEIASATPVNLVIQAG